MDYIDLKYSRLVSSYLTGVRDVGNGTVRFRCPFCGDSKKSESKVRGYFYELEGRCNFKCHNCGASMGLLNFLSEISPALARDYKFERFSKKPLREDPAALFETNTAEVFGSKTLIDRYCVAISTLDSEHHAREYLEGRMIPDSFYTDLFYTDSALKIMAEIPEYEDTAKRMKDRDAIVIPFYDQDNVLMCIQFRFFDGDLRYLTLRLRSDALKVWGLDRVDKSKTVYVVEGVFDAMFIDNSIAVAGASLLSSVKYVASIASDFVLIFDKDYMTNYEVYSQFVKAINGGYKVVMYDHEFEAKDINAQIQHGTTIPQMQTYIEKRTFSGLMAKLEMSKFRPPRKRKYG